MTAISCARCSKTIEESDSYMSARGAVCDICNSNVEVDEMVNKGLFSARNIGTVMLVGGGMTCDININGINYGGLVMGAICFLVAIYFLVSALKYKAEPALLRFGRPAALFVAGSLSFLGALLSLWAS